MSFGDRSRFGKAELPELRPAAGRVPPHDLDAEAAVLSAVLLSSDAFDLKDSPLRSCRTTAQRLTHFRAGIAESIGVVVIGAS